LGSLGVVSPVLAVTFLIPALNLGGIPPFSGFVGKLAVVQAGAEVGGVLMWVLVAGAMVTSLLTLYVVVRVWSKAFWRPRADAPEGAIALAKPLALLPSDEYVEFDERDEVGRMPWSMLAPTWALIVVSLLMTVFAGPLLAVTDGAAESLRERVEYLVTVPTDATPERFVDSVTGVR